MTNKTLKFDIAEHLETDKDIQEFLEEAAQECTPSEFIHALNTAARAKGMTEVAKKAGVTRGSLYKSLSGNGRPKFETVNKIIESLGCHISITPN